MALPSSEDAKSFGADGEVCRAFGELRSLFVQIISPLEVDPPAEAARVQFRSDQCVSSSFLQDFCVLLRRCTNMLHLMKLDFDLILEEGQMLLGMLIHLCRVIVSLQQRLVNDRLVTGGDECSLKEYISSSPFLSTILEVFADELLIHQNLREFLVMAYGISCEKLTFHVSITCDIGIIMELVSTHFLISYCEKTTFKGLSHLKVSCKLSAMESPKLSLTAALALLRTRGLSSAPCMLQSHVIFLVSKCMAASRDLNLTAMNCYLTAFEQSVVLYTCLASHFPLHHDVIGAKRQSRSFVTEHRLMKNGLGVSYDSYVCKDTSDAVDLQSRKLVDHLSKDSSVFLWKTKAETITICSTICSTYINENKHAIQEQWREEICSILNFIIQGIVGETGKGQLQLSEEVNWHEVYYGAALLNLMGSSLLQIIMGLSEQGTKTLRDYDICREYLFVSDITNRFSDQYVVCDILAAYSTKWLQTNRMLAHITSLLFYAIDRRIFPLCEGSILVMIAVMNLLVFKDGNLDAVRTVCGCVTETSSSQLPASKISMGTSRRSSSIRIASKFQKARAGLSHESSRWDGANFLKCVVKDHISDLDALTDFVVCIPGRDYHTWLRNRGSFKKKWEKKWAILKHQRKTLVSRHQRKMLRMTV